MFDPDVQPGGLRRLTNRRFLGIVIALCLLAFGCGSATNETTAEDPAGAAANSTDAADAEATTAQQPASEVPATAMPVPTVAPTAAPEPPAPAPTATAPTATAQAAPTATVLPASGDPKAAAARHAEVSAQVQEAVDAWRERNGAPGVSAALLLPGWEPIQVASGVSDLTADTPVTTDDYFRMASTTKPMTATLILQLVEDGLIELDETVSTYLGDWLGDHPSEDQITVRQLMDHTNGLIEYALDINFFIEAAGRQDRAYEPEELLEFLSRQDPLFEPGTAYRYETGGFVAAGLLIELLRENSAAAEMRDRIFEPAGASEIYLTPEEFPPAEVVHGYARAELYTALTLLPGVNDDLGHTVNDGEPVIDVLAGEQAVLQSAGWTGGGNEAQLVEVARIFRAMFDGTLLKPESIEAMTTPALSSSRYGLGIDVGTTRGGTAVWSHGGGVPGFRSQAGWMPDLETSYAFSANLIPLPNGRGVNELRDALEQITLEALT